MDNETEVKGHGFIRVHDEQGNLKQEVEFHNLLTTSGDKYFAQVIAKHGGSSDTPTAVNGMKLGTGTTTPAKSGAAAALGTYISGSQRVFDAGFPAAAAHTGTNTGWDVTYQAFWAAGTATNSAITEVALVNDAATNATTSEANTYARATFTAVNKAAGDTLTIAWTHTILGA